MANINTLSWVGSNEREDNTPYLPADRHGYNVAIQNAADVQDPDANIVFTAISQEYDFSVPIADLGAPLTEGTWNFYVQDEDKEGRRSDWSPALAVVWVIAAPKPPTGLVAL